MLGDVIDRGPSSAALVARLMRYTRSSDRFIVLKGNHEQVMTDAISGDLYAGEQWMRHGGGATLKSWGVPEELVETGPLDAVLRNARRRIPTEVLQWMAQLKLYHRSGGVLFVHAGIRTGVPLQKQDIDDLMWNREGFIDNEALHPFLVVHGHTVFEDGPDVRVNRIGVDTGAYRTNRLLALGLEDDQTWPLITPGRNDGVPTSIG